MKMLTTTRAHSSRACWISLTCPACSAPMVGTNPIGPECLHEAMSSRMEGIVSTRCARFMGHHERGPQRRDVPENVHPSRR